MGVTRQADFFDKAPKQSDKDIGVMTFDDYIRALFVFDSGFLSALFATILWTVVNMILQWTA